MGYGAVVTLIAMLISLLCESEIVFPLPPLHISLELVSRCTRMYSKPRCKAPFGSGEVVGAMWHHLPRRQPGDFDGVLRLQSPTAPPITHTGCCALGCPRVAALGRVAKTLNLPCFFAPGAILHTWRQPFLPRYTPS